MRSHDAVMPALAGVGYKPQHAQAIADDPGAVGWFEVHAENYMVSGGPRPAQLEALRARYPLSLHGVGLSLGSGEMPDRDHLQALRTLVDRFEPALVSEHLAWSSHDGLYLADLLPVAFTDATLNGVVAAIGAIEEALGRRILIENPASYLPRPEGWLAEVDFIGEAARRSGCGLLVDVNNVHVSGFNLGFDAAGYLDALPADGIGEIHLAGHAMDANDGDPVLIDDHGAAVDDAVWTLYERLVARTGPRPTLIDWDNHVPEWPVLREQARLANVRARAARQRVRMAS
jgi:uncharacterized protein